MSVLNYLVVTISIVIFSESHKLSSIEETYKKGVLAYSKEDWAECSQLFEESLHLYKLYKSIVINCRLTCKNEHNKPLSSDSYINDLKIYEALINRRNCLMKCHDNEFANNYLNNDISNNMLETMQNKNAYEYLHMCYYQTHNLQRAASSAATFLASNPDNKQMKSNLETYLKKSDVNEAEVVDLEKEYYIVLFDRAIKFYNNNIWNKAVYDMEEAIVNYLIWEDNCRLECERQPEQELSPEFVITITNNIASYLQCQQSCQDKLKLIKYDSGVHYLAEMLNYLQICYYHLEKIEKAAISTATYLALMPNDADMLHNKEIYSTLVDSDSFTERSDIIQYLKRDQYEKELLKLFQQKNNIYHNGSN
ncbi:cartilage-associated protein [Aphomia sociella]